MNEEIQELQEFINSDPRLRALTKHIKSELNEILGHTHFVLTIAHPSKLVFCLSDLDHESQADLIRHMADTIDHTYEEVIREH